jgi:hypothetical protein
MPTKDSNLASNAIINASSQYTYIHLYSSKDFLPENENCFEY